MESDRQVSVTSTSQTEYTAAGLTAGLSYRFQVKDGWVGMGRLKAGRHPKSFLVTVSGQVMVVDSYNGMIMISYMIGLIGCGSSVLAVPRRLFLKLERALYRLL